MKEIATPDRPREKLLRAGASALGDNELVALVLGAGTRRRGALAIAQELLAAVGGAEGLLSSDSGELRRVPGVGAANAARILAAVELGRRVVVRPAGERPLFDSPRAIAQYLLPLFGGHRVERFGVLLLDAKHRLIRTSIISVGEVEASEAPPREIFREAILASASGVALFHNHPSGDPAPSKQDMALTAHLVRAGDTLGVRVVDHIILGRHVYYSFKEDFKL